MNSENTSNQSHLQDPRGELPTDDEEGPIPVPTVACTTHQRMYRSNTQEDDNDPHRSMILVDYEADEEEEEEGEEEDEDGEIVLPNQETMNPNTGEEETLRESSYLPDKKEEKQPQQQLSNDHEDSSSMRMKKRPRSPSVIENYQELNEQEVDKKANSPIGTTRNSDFSPIRGDHRYSSAKNHNVNELGVYIPPFKRRQMEEETFKKNEAMIERRLSSSTSTTPLKPLVTVTEQRQSWEDLKRTIHGTINRLNVTTIKPLILQLFQKANIIRGKGLLAKAILRATITSPPYASVYAALIAVISSKLPEIGELVMMRTILSFRRFYARKEKRNALAMATFLGHLFNQGVCHELLCLQILTLLLEDTGDGGGRGSKYHRDPTDDGVEVAIQFFYVVGQALLATSPAGVHAVMERFRSILHEGSVGKRVQYKIEELMRERKKNFLEYPSLIPELDLVEKEDQIMFELSLDDENFQKEEELDIFRVDPEWSENEELWMTIRKEIIGDDNDEENEDESHSIEEEENLVDDDNNDEDEDEDEDGELEQPQNTNVVPRSLSMPHPIKHENKITIIHDLSEKDLIHLRRTIYLTIMSSASFEECTHKLTKIDIPTGKEVELINMIIECCSQERTFLKYYGLISGRFCLIHERWRKAFEESFVDQYNTIHRLETNKLRNVAKLFAHLLHSDSLPWSVLSVIHLNEDETTSSSRIFIKILVQTLAETLGMAVLIKRFETDDPETNEWFKGMFPKDNPRNTRYAINFFTSIGLGPLTDGLREYLKNAPKLIMLQAQADGAKNSTDKGSESSDDSSSTSSSSTSSESSSSSSYTSDSSSDTSDSSSYTSDSSSYTSCSTRSYSSSSSSYTSCTSSSRSRSSSYSSHSSSSTSRSSRWSRESRTSDSESHSQHSRKKRLKRK